MSIVNSFSLIEIRVKKLVYFGYTVYNDPLGQTHTSTSSNNYFHMTFVLFCDFWKVGTDLWTEICVKIMITTGRVCIHFVNPESFASIAYSYFERFLRWKMRRRWKRNINICLFISHRREFFFHTMICFLYIRNPLTQL